MEGNYGRRSSLGSVANGYRINNNNNNNIMYTSRKAVSSNTTLQLRSGHARINERRCGTTVQNITKATRLKLKVLYHIHKHT